MLNKINIKKILVDHFATLRNANDENTGVSDILLFFSIPIVAAGITVLYLGIYLSDSLINILITSLSIFVGLLLNLLVIIFDIISKINEGQQQDQLKKKFLREIYSNISFCILLSIVTIGALLFSMANDASIKTISNFISDSLLFVFGLTLLMVLKRVHILLSNEFNVGNKS